MPEATLETIAKDIRKVLLDFDMLRREVKDVATKITGTEESLKFLKKEIENLKGGQ